MHKYSKKNYDKLLLSVFVVFAIAICITYIGGSYAFSINDKNTIYMAKKIIAIEDFKMSEIKGSTSVNKNTSVLNDNEMRFTTFTFKKPGDKLSYEFNMTNRGNVDVVIKDSSFSLYDPIFESSSQNEEDLICIRDGLKHRIVYASTNENHKEGQLVKIGDIIPVRTSIRIRIEFYYDKMSLCTLHDEVSISKLKLVYNNN